MHRIPDDEIMECLNKNNRRLFSLLDKPEYFLKINIYFSKAINQNSLQKIITIRILFVRNHQPQLFSSRCC